MAKVKEISTYQVDNANILKYVPRPFWPTFTTNQQTWHKTPIGEGLYAGADNLAALFKRPGSVSPGISGAIAPLVAAESDRIQRSGANQLSQAAGTMARTGVGGGMYAALEAAMNRANTRDIANSRRQGVAQSEGLRREDLGRMMEFLNYLTNTTMQGRNIQLGHAAANLQSNQVQQQNQAANLATYASLLAAFV